MDSVLARQFNDLFGQRVSSREGLDKLAETGGLYIRDKLREVNFTQGIIPPQRVTKADCQRSVNHDTLVKLVEIEPRSRAMTVSFRGDATARYIRGERVEAAFFKIMSENLMNNEQELLAYEMPITKIIEENSLKDMDEIVDREFLVHCENAVQQMQYEANASTYTALSSTTVQAGGVVEFSVVKGELARAVVGTPDATVRPIQRPDIPRLRKLLHGRRLRAAKMLMTEVDYDDVNSWTLEDFGDKIQSETAVEGYKYNTLIGLEYIRTIKVDILRPGNVYCFTKPEFFGRYYILNDPKFYINKIGNMVEWWAWMDMSLLLANIASVVKLELYSGDANPSTDAQGLVAASTVVPVDEEALGAVNNRAEQGLKFPAVKVH